MFGEAEFNEVCDNMQNYVGEGETINFDVVELLPETQYEFKVRAKNDRSENAFSGNISDSGDTISELTPFTVPPDGVHWEQFTTVPNCLKLLQTSVDPYQIFIILNPYCRVIILILQLFQTCFTVTKQSFPS